MVLGVAMLGERVGQLEVVLVVAALFDESLRHLDFHFVNIARSVRPVIGAAYAWPWFSVAVSPLSWAGAVLLLGSVPVCAGRPNDRRSSAAATSVGRSP